MQITTKISDSNFQYICRSLAQKKITYITPYQFKEDYSNEQVYILEENEKPVAMCSLVKNEKHKNFAIKRLVCFKKKNAGKGYANILIQFISNQGFFPLVVTPWEDNAPMRHLLEKNNFHLKYIFSEKWCFYEKSA